MTRCMYEKRHERHDRLPATEHLESDAEVTKYLILAMAERLTADHDATKKAMASSERKARATCLGGRTQV